MRGRSWSASRNGLAWPIDGAASSAVSLPRRLFGTGRRSEVVPENRTGC